ncbi:tandem-95 repeat protein [Rheinheimera baltica]|uniref:tandem-95 repeat protein n=2 Tax=Rheinheimera baltica TaxID=67576 RepID=UPI0012EC8B93|nr:tandem-95 repeat protein [Rheinheimera baltica]
MSSVSVPANATYISGQNLDFTINFNDNVTVNTGGGTPQLSITVGATTRQATYQSGSGTSALLFRYTVQAGESDSDGIAVGTLSANGGTLRDSASNDANLTLNSVGATTSVFVDATAPAVTSVTVPSNATYTAGQNLDFSINFNENVTVNTGGGTPQLSITVGATTRQATYQSGSGTGALLFRYTVQAGESDSDGIAIGALSANGGTLRDAVNNDATLTLNSVGATTGVLVDAAAPTVASVSVPANATYISGQNLDFTINFSENITVNTGGGTPQLAITVGATTRQATYISGSGTSALLFRYTVQAGDSDTDGISIGTLAANGGTLRDAVNNDATLTLNSGGVTTSVLVDASAPAVASVSVPANATYVSGQNLDFTINFSENITVNTGGSTPQLAITVGATTRQATYISGSGTSALLFRYTVQTGDSDTDGISIGTLAANGGTLRDAVNNDATLTLNSVGATTAVLVDAVAPDVPSVPDLTTDSDTGASSTDNITFDTTPTFVGVAEANSTVSLASSVDGPLANTTADGSGNWSLTSGVLSQGNHNIIALAADTAGNTSVASAALSITIDTTVPAINYAAFDQNQVTTENQTALSVTLNGAETGTTASYSISSSGGGTAVTASNLAITDAAQQFTGIDLSGLADGSITLSFTLTDTAGNTRNVLNYLTKDLSAPVNNVPASVSVSTVDTLPFVGANLISVTETSDLTTVLSVSSGSFYVDEAAAACMTITGNNSGSVSIQGLSANVNDVLATLVYTPDGNGDFTISVTSTDAFSNSDTDNIALTVTATTLLATSPSDTGLDATIDTDFDTDKNDGDGLSLREALHYARSGDTITFDFDNSTAGNQGGTINLGGNNPLVMAQSGVTLDGDTDNNGTRDVTIFGGNNGRVLTMNANVTDITIESMALTGGSAASGGAIYMDAGSSLTTKNAEISYNNAISGAAVYAVQGASLTLINSRLSGNNTDSHGGAIYLADNATVLNLINSTLSGNYTSGESAQGGAIYALNGATINTVNSTLSGNRTNGEFSAGGAVRLSDATGNFYNSTIVGNAAVGTTGGVSANSTVNFVNTVVAGNMAGTGATAGNNGSALATGGTLADTSGPVTSAINSYFSSFVDIVSDTNSLNNQGTDNLLLGNLAFNAAGKVLTHRPLSGSALVAAGSNANLPLDTFDLDNDTNTAEALPVDANGSTRISGIVDIGSVEGNATPVLSNVDGGFNYVEGDVGVPIDSNATVSDAELDALNGGAGNYSGAQLILVRQGGAITTDIFGFNDDNGISLAGNTLLKNGQSIASVNSSVVGQLSLGFTNANGETPTSADVDAILQQLTFSSSSDEPGSDASISITFTDDEGASTNAIAILTITDINDPPVFTVTALNPSYTENGAAVAIFSNASGNAVEFSQTIEGFYLSITNVVDGENEILNIYGEELPMVVRQDIASIGATPLDVGRPLNFDVSFVGTTATIYIGAADIDPADMPAVINSITYRNTSENPGAADRIVTLVRALDSGGSNNGGSNSGMINIASTITVNAVNDGPAISGSPATTVVQDAFYSFTPTASDVDNGTLTFSISNKPVWASFNSATGALTGTPGNADVGTSTGIVISVSDGGLSAALPAFSLTVTNVNDAPTISGTPTTIVAQDATYSFIPTATDADPGTTLTFSISNKPVWASFNSVTGALTGTPGNADVGTSAGIIISMSDGSLSATLPAFSLTVTNVNDAPTINGTPATRVTQDNAYSFMPTAEDVDGDDLTFSITNKPSWAVFDTASGALTGTPTNTDVGITTNIVITVSDADLTASLPAFSITVDNTNDAPVISGAPATTVAQDAVYSFTPTASDPDDDSLTFSIVNKPSWATFDSATGSMTGTPTNSDVGTTTAIAISVSDGEFSASLPVFNLTVTNVNDTPVISGTPATSVVKDTAYSFVPTATDADDDTLTFSITNKPSWAAFDTTTGALTGTPVAADVGTTTGIVISVSDGTLSAALPAFNLEVTSVNSAPVISGTPATSVVKGTAYSFVPTATDADDDTLTFSITNKPSWAAFNTTTGALTGTPVAADVGTTSGIVISVSDGTLSAALPAFNLEVTSVNSAPVISGMPATTVAQDTAYSFMPTATDPEDDTLTFSITNKPSWAAFNTTTGALTGTPVAADVGTTTGIVISVSDGTLSAALPAFNLEVTSVNSAPVISGMPATTVAQDTAYSFMPTATDPEDDTLTFSITNKPSWAAFDTTTGALTGTPVAADVGTTSGIVISVSDGSLSASLDAFNIEVTRVNAAPVATDDNLIQTFTVDGVYLLDVLANDTDANSDTLSITAAKTSIGQVVILNGQLQLTAPENFSGNVSLSYSISDGELSDSANVTVLIDGSNPAAPVITVPADLTVNATGLFTKVDLGVATAVDSNGNRIAVSLLNGTPLFAPGTHQLYWQASDAAGVRSTATQLLQVKPLVSLSKNQVVINNSRVSFSVLLNGKSPSYPVNVAYTISGSGANLTDHNLTAGEVQIVSGTQATVSFDVFADLTTVSSKEIVITLDSSLNRGATSRTVISVVDENLAPALSLTASQQNVQRLLFGKDQGVVTVTAVVADPNPGDSVTTVWQADAALVNQAGSSNQFVFDPASLGAGVYRLAITATDNATPALSNTSELYLQISDTLPVLTDADSNNNLIPDNVEGLGDANGNGIADYLDPGFDCNVIPEQLAIINAFVAEGEPGICLRKGATAAIGNGGGIELLDGDQQWLEPDMQADNIGGVFDFILLGLPTAGDSFSIVLPQRQPLPLNAVYRKYTAENGWANFVSNANNGLFSSAGEPGYCPPPGDSSWQSGLTAGHWCVQLTIEDGGPNDADGIVNGSIVDPGGVAVLVSSNARPVAVDDNYTLLWNQPHLLNVLANDSDADNDNLIINLASAYFGTVTISEDGQSLWYTPDNDFIGPDTLSYSVSDGQGGSGSATVNVSVYYNRAPVVNNLSVNTDDKTAIVIDVLATATDADNDTLTIATATATQGVVTITPEQTLRYVPRTGFDGNDTISFTVSDGRGNSSAATVTVTVKAYEVITVVNKSSGGTFNGWPLLLLSMLLVLRRKPGVAVIATLLSALSFNAQANWSLDGFIGQSKAKQSSAQLQSRLPDNVSLLSLDNSDTSWSLGASYAFNDQLAVQAYYVDLGDTSVALQAETLTPEQLHQTIANVGPILAEGARLGASYRFWQFNNWHLAAQAGVFSWKSSQTSQAGTAVINNKHDGTDIYWALNTGYRISDKLTAQASFTRYKLDRNNADNLMLGVSYSF